jgi:hypothetical protein
MAIETFVDKAKIQHLPKAENQPLKVARNYHHGASTMKWKNRTLFAYYIYRFVMDTGHTVDTDSISSPQGAPSAQIGNLNETVTKEDLLDKLWALVASQNEQFFVQFEDGTKNVVPATELTEFILVNLDKKPKQWPTNFASPKECDDFLELAYAKFEKQIETSHCSR